MSGSLRVPGNWSDRVARLVIAATLPMVVLAGAGLLVASDSARELVASLGIVMAMAAAQMSFGRAALRAPESDRSLWAWASLSAVTLFVGEYADLMHRLGVFRTEWAPAAVSFVAFAIAAAFGCMALWHLARPAIVSRQTLAGYAIDLVVIQLVFLTGMLTIVLPLTGDTETTVGLAQGIPMALYPSLAVGIVGYSLVFKRTHWESHQVLLVAWLGGLGVRHVTLLATVSTTYAAPPGSDVAVVTDLMLIASYVLAAVAGLLRANSPEREKSHVLDARQLKRPVWPSLAAPALAMVNAPAVYLRAVDREWTPTQVWIVVGVTMAIGIAVTGRSYLLNAENSQLRLRSTTDPLTGLSNHREFHERLDAEVRRSERERTPLSIAVLDVDDFDQVNNLHGHEAGDRRLHSMAGRLRTASRLSDVVCRIGGDEFALIMPDTRPVEAYKVCLRAQDMLRETVDDCPLPLGVSIGIAGMPDHASRHEDLVEKADGALYWAKFHGREHVVIYDEDLVLALGPEERIALLEEESYLNMVQLLASAVDARAPFSERHSRNVADLAVSLGRVLSFDAERLTNIETAALLHDVGKVGVPDAVLRKTGDLTAAEHVQAMEHPSLAVRILSAIPRPEILPWIEAHHEHWNGEGSPNGLAAEEIPLEARMIAICSAYDTMTSDRPDEDALEPEAALAEILSAAGTRFDPELATSFVEMLVSRFDEECPLPSE